MIRTAPNTFLETTKGLVRNPSALAIFAALYALLLATLYWFIATREATVWQVIITLVGLVVIPAEFFILQAAILDQAHDQRFRWRAILIDALKMFVVTIPILIVAYVLWYLLNKWQVHFPAPKVAITFPPAPPKPQPVHWPTLLFATLRCLLFGIAFPLATIHKWIEVTRNDLKTLFAGGAKGILKRIGRGCAHAFSSNSVLTYALGLIVFVLIPYALLFVPLTIKGNKAEFAVFVFRLVLVFVLTLFGWIVTVGALAKLPREIAAVDAKPASTPLKLSEEPTG
ncbi:MAG: hypothetical protein DMF70_00890 [Acidobacteria bacterium]|nr:MAG: hypothetical protein DMF70_00890 [Acidobacteriota bacterium]